MNHPAELALHSYLDKAVKGKSSISKDTAIGIAKDVQDAIIKQFGGGSRGNFRLRMSNVGRPYCQLWFEKNKPETAAPKPTTFIMNMLIGDIVEAVLKGLMRESGIQYTDSQQVTLDIGTNKINGTYDIALEGAVDDIKSASDWSYRNKFDSFETLKSGDAFGYIGQLAGYAKATGLKPGGWWVVNKANGKFKYVPATNLDMDEELDKIKKVSDKLKTNQFERCFEPEVEKFRGKETGNMMLCKTCSFCDYKRACWPNLIEKPAVKSQAKEPKIVEYTHLADEYAENKAS